MTLDWLIISQLGMSNWEDMMDLVLELKQKHRHAEVSLKCNVNPKLRRWVSNLRDSYRKYKRIDGQKGDLGRMRWLESIGLVDDMIRKYEDKKMHCTDDRISAPIIVSSMSPTFPSNTQNTTEEIPFSTGMKRKKNDEKKHTL
jgi:hypothetical protein